MDYKSKSLQAHKKYRGKLEVRSKMPIRNKNDLSVAYTPGVADVSNAIAKDTSLAYEYTIKGNSVLVVTDGSAVLGLGNIGPEAAMPVMEGKAALFKTFAGIDAYPICLATQDTEEIIRTIKNISVGFGGINLEDISAPRCFEIEERLKAELSIPVMHDDQHGTAIVVLAALINALRVVKKSEKEVRIVINGAGSAAMAIFNLLMLYCVPSRNITMVDSRGIVHAGRNDLNSYKKKIASISNGENREGGLKEALVGADVFIGVSVANSLQPEWVEDMADQPVVFAMANPNPEISLERAKKTKIRVFGTGRSDYPNQINNVLVFPGIFRGALDARVPAITDEMKLAAAQAIARLVSPHELKPGYILPKPFDMRVVKAVANAVKRATRKI
jgi:malate dehydrogenase (oxaloacetate-decarboxylating)